MENNNINEEALEIRSKLEEYIEKYNKDNPNTPKSLEDVFIGEIQKFPSAIGCFKNNNSWINYGVGDRYELMVKGPFSKEGIIKALSVDLFIPSKYVSEKFTDAEYETYLSGYVPYENYSLNNGGNQK